MSSSDVKDVASMTAAIPALLKRGLVDTSNRGVYDIDECCQLRLVSTDILNISGPDNHPTNLLHRPPKLAVSVLLVAPAGSDVSDPETKSSEGSRCPTPFSLEYITIPRFNLGSNMDFLILRDEVKSRYDWLKLEEVICNFYIDHYIKQYVEKKMKPALQVEEPALENFHVKCMANFTTFLQKAQEAILKNDLLYDPFYNLPFSKDVIAPLSCFLPFGMVLIVKCSLQSHDFEED